MSYCPIALMEDIRGSGVDNGDDGCGSNSSSSGGSSDDSTLISVHFPQLPPNPPTDDSETTTTTSSSTDGQASDDQQQGTQSWHGSLDKGQGVSKRVSHCNDDDAASSGSGGSSKRKPPPETIASSQPSSQPSSKRVSHSDGHVDTDDDDDEMEIDELDFSNSATATSADQIRTALNKLVMTAKRRKKRLKQQQQQAAQASSSASVGVGGGAPTAGKPSKSPPRHDNNNNNNEEVRKPSLKQRPIQVIMTWMDSFQDNENIQLSCLQSLPIILEDPPNRLTAQADGLASIVLYNMAAFPSNSLLQLTAFHTLVVLLRPLGANEGMVHKAHVHSGNATSKSSKGIRSINHKKHSSSSSSHHHHKTSINNARHHHHHHHHPKNMSSPLQQPHHQSSSSSITAAVSGGLVDGTYEPRWEENGVRVMLDSLRRFSSDRYLQAMGCWAMVNAALYPSLKASLLRLGGVYTVTNAMMLHPNVEAVQFRGLFALINLVIPDNKNKKDGDGSSIHSHIYQIARLTILAMKNFHTNKSILNRGCLVLRNLSLTPAFVKILARTPGCVDMLLHCRQMCPRDVLVQRSARTIMILVQRVTEKKNIEVGGAKKNGSFKMPQSMPLEASMASASASSSFAMPTAMSTSSSSTPAEMAPPKAMMRERE
ncbi:hypothetical protein ACHAXR_005853 [Thalassiosira sp. AJA248-18]